MTDALLVLAGPLLAATVLGIVPALRRSGKPAAAVSLAGIGISLGAAIALFARVYAQGAPYHVETVWAPLTTLLSGCQLSAMAVAELRNLTPCLGRGWVVEGTTARRAVPGSERRGRRQPGESSQRKKPHKRIDHPSLP